MSNFGSRDWMTRKKRSREAFSKRFTLNADKVRYDHSGRYAAFGFFQYFGP